MNRSRSDKCLAGAAARELNLESLPPSAQSDAALGLQGTNVWVYPSFDHDANVEHFARDIDAPLPAVYLSFPSAKDPDHQRRHPGKSTVEAITMLPYAAFGRWGETRWKRRGDEYKELLAARLRAELQRQVPSVVGNIAHTELSTPVTTRHFMNYGHGEIYGIASTPDRFLMHELGARTPIRGLYLTGQDAATLGVVGALYGGVIGASVESRQFLFARAPLAVTQQRQSPLGQSVFAQHRASRRPKRSSSRLPIRAVCTKAHTHRS